MCRSVTIRERPPSRRSGAPSSRNSVAAGEAAEQHLAMVLYVRPVSPMDQAWEADRPAYRVYFFDALNASDEWELTGCDVGDALKWISDEANGRGHVLYAVAVTADGVGLVRLAGSDPNRQGSLD